MKQVLLGVVLTAFFVQPVAAAGFQSGNSLLARCTSKNANNRGFCYGYIAGITDVLAGGRNNINGYRACFSRGQTVGQMRDIVVLWLQKNPAQRHYSAGGLVALALEKAFPCKK